MVLRTGLLLSILFLWASYSFGQPQAYIPNFDDGTVSVIDSGTNTVVSTINVGTNPRSAAVTPDGLKVYVPRDILNARLAVIQTSTNTLLTNIDLSDNSSMVDITGASDVVITPDGQYAYVSSPNSKAVVKIDTATDTVVEVIEFTQFVNGALPSPFSLAITPDGAFVYVVAISPSSALLRIQTSDDTIVSGHLDIANPRDIDITPDGSKVYVTRAGSRVQIVDIDGMGTPSLGTLIVLDDGACEARPNDVAVDPRASMDPSMYFAWVPTTPLNLIPDGCDGNPLNIQYLRINTANDNEALIGGTPESFSTIGFKRDGTSFYGIRTTGTAREVVPTDLANPSAPINLGDGPSSRSPYFIGPDTALLTVTTTGDGGGTITSDLAGIDCGLTCEARYPIGTEVTLSAMPNGISEFLGWSGPDDCMDGVVTVDADITCTADFARTEFTVDVMINPTGGGSVTTTPAGIDCPDVSCSELFDKDETITLNEFEDPDFNFVDWTGDDDCADGVIDMLMVDTSCTANFELKRFNVNIDKKGNGIGNVTSVPAGIDCPFDCSQDFVIHTFVNLIATPDPDSDFLGWAGDPNCEDGVIQDLTEDTTCEPTFNLKQFTLTVGKIGDGEGTVRSDPAGIDCGDDCSELYNIHTVVTLTPTPRFVSKFVGWTGDPDCADGVVTMNRDVMCTAEFMSTAPPPTSAEVSIVKSASPDPVEAGSELTYSFDINNSGPNAATGVKISDVLPEGVSFVSASQGCGVENGNVTCSIDTLSVSETRTFSVVVIPEIPGNLMNSATVKAATPDSNPSNNTSTITTQVVGDVTAFLSVDATVDNVNTVPGGMFAIPVDISNPDTAQTNSVTVTKQTATGVVFTVDLPEGFDIEALSTTVGTCNFNTLQCTIGDILPGEVVTVLVDAIASDEEGVFNVSFSASTSDGQVFEGNATVDVGGTVVVDGGGGGGCSVASVNPTKAEMFGFAVPFMFLALMLVVKRRMRIS